MAEAEDAARARKKAACFIMVVCFCVDCVDVVVGEGMRRRVSVKKDLVDILLGLDLDHSSQA